MPVAPTWLHMLAGEDGALASSPGASVRPALAQQFEAERAAWLRRRSVQPKPVAVGSLPADARRVADVLDEDPQGGKPYLKLGKIGSGGMGVVLLARQRSTGREVAIKAVHPERQHPAYLSAFRQECRTTAGLEHPNVPPVYDAGADFMAMKRLTGGSLEERLREGLGLDVVVEVLLKACDALAFAHSRGVVHRDIKGENVFIGSFGEVWVMDWGLAAGYRPLEDGTWLSPPVTSQPEMCAGTAICAPPEVAIADLSRLAPTMDLFLLGALLYRALCGSYPYEAASTKEALQRAARRDMVPLLVRAPRSPFRLVQAAERAMAWDADDRGSLAQFAGDLKTWQRTSGGASEGHVLLAQARTHLAAGMSATRDEERYRRIGQAIADAERALTLCPELRGAHELAAHARTVFAQAAQAAGDRTLARLIAQGFTPP